MTHFIGYVHHYTMSFFSIEAPLMFSLLKFDDPHNGVFLYKNLYTLKKKSTAHVTLAYSATIFIITTITRDRKTRGVAKKNRKEEISDFNIEKKKQLEIFFFGLVYKRVDILIYLLTNYLLTRTVYFRG